MSHRADIVPLREAIDLVDHKVNLLGVIVEFGFPRKSMGTGIWDSPFLSSFFNRLHQVVQVFNYVCVLKIVDDSHQKPEISVNIFAKNLDELPRVLGHGDLVHLSRVVMKVCDGEVFAVFNKMFSSFALFQGKASNNLNPYQVSSRFCHEYQDDMLISHLRAWLLNFQLDAGSSEYLRSLKDIEAGKFFDLICKVLYVYEASKDEWILFVWDGTDTPPLSLETKLEDEVEKPLPLNFESFTLPRETLCTFPRVGTILRVVPRAYEKLELHFKDSNHWVKFRNISCQVCSGLWYGILMPNSKVRLLSNEDDFVIKCRRNYDDRVSAKVGRLPLSFNPHYCCVTVTDNENLPYMTLMEILTYSEVTAKFKSVVRVVAACPWRAERFFRSRVGMRSHKIRFTLEDPTARIHAYLFAEDGMEFFEGFPPIDVLTNKRNRLLGIIEGGTCKGENVLRNPPWVECCIKSYYKHKNDCWGSRRFRIFGTRLVS
ncbi:PREDICTED: protection of telomeres protein 1a-like isoform X2 [Nelumbo nucifera]|uniref:Protection of telomeres protein 1 n=2 Tax=Nelumbo nucifera TaxID=4432 RepID=A0A822ZA95_NELNU|nr:PREDICTED: protection of telomeres protein 1a-like isoform X2 [Nelumbo nucifera]DAD38448.1 TPA_asm: hypothetical protein HUJ06_009089 [Nelumbo nucifera]